jgi:uracil DNA glycosylase
VLLLNTCLTVRQADANSHSGKGWERLTGKVIEIVNKVKTSGVVFLAWGSPAQKRCAGVSPRHLVLKSVHPSPLSAYQKGIGGVNFVSELLVCEAWVLMQFSLTLGTLRRQTSG